MSTLRAATVVVLFALLAGCASPGPSERRAARLAQFEAASSAPVPSFRYWHLYRWEDLGPQSLAIWTRNDEVWLLQVERPCTDLEFAQTIRLSSTMNRVQSRFDYVEFDDQRCRIIEIHPVDADAVRDRPDA